VNEAKSSSLCLKVVVILCFERDIQFECGLARNFENDGQSDILERGAVKTDELKVVLPGLVKVIENFNLRIDCGIRLDVEYFFRDRNDLSFLNMALLDFFFLGVTSTPTSSCILDDFSGGLAERIFRGLSTFLQSIEDFHALVHEILFDLFLNLLVY